MSKGLLLFVNALVLFAVSAIGQPQKSGKVKKPNIIFILADDIGYEGFGTYGSAAYQTPYIDKLAASGVKFTNCYATPLCTPSRIMLMTGKYNFRNYEDFGYLNPTEKTFANILQDAGYTTCISGKWQLNGIAQKKPGWESKDRPYEFGFDEYCLWQLQYAPKYGERYANPLIVENGKTLARDRDAYGPDIFNDFVLDFIKRKKDGDKPFFVYYSMPLVHDPFVPTPASDDWSDTSKRYYDVIEHFDDMVAYMDKSIGTIIDMLEKTGLAENTLVIFAGDNGTNRRIVTSMKDGTSVKGDKGHLTDGGTHVPLIAWWKGKSLINSVNTDLIDFSDFLPTILQAARVDLPEDFVMDGVSFLPQLLGQKTLPKQYIYMYYQPKWGGFENGVFVRDKTYKLYGDGRFYNVKQDVQEQNKLNEKQMSPDEKAVKAKLEAVLQKMPNVKPLSGEEK